MANSSRSWRRLNATASMCPALCDRSELVASGLPAACLRRAAVHSAVGLRKRDNCGERSEMMALLREGVAQHAALYLALGGLLLGALFGAVVFATNFCAMGSLSDIHNFGDRRRFRTWLLAAAVALVGARLLAAAGWVDLDKSMYLAATGFNWTGHVLGGLMLGFGMVFAGGCPSRNLARAGGGDVRSLLALLVLGLFAHMTLGGLLAPLRAALEQATSIALGAQGLG